MGAGNVRSFELATGAGWMGAVRAKSLQSARRKIRPTRKKDRKTEGKFNIHLQSNRQYYCSYQYKHCQLLID